MSLPSLLSSRVASEDGNIIVLFGLLLPFFLLLGALSVDVGNWYVHKRHLQMQADAAAFAGGGLFGECFKPDAVDANGAIYAEATKYNGGPGSTYNTQVGGTDGVTVVYQSQAFHDTNGRHPPDDPDDVEGEPCDNLLLDVKATHEDVGAIFNPPDWGPLSADVHGHARIELQQITSMDGSLPLAVPDVDPTRVAATFVKPDGTYEVVDLTEGAPAGSLTMWSGTGAIDIPSGKVRVRIGMGRGSQQPVCAPTNGAGGTGYACFDNGDFGRGLAAIAGVAPGGTLVQPAQSAFAVTPMTLCAGAPLFSDVHLDGAATCAASLEVRVNLAGINPTQVRLRATIDGQREDLAYDAADGVWRTLTPYPWSIPADDGPHDVELRWKYGTAQERTYDGVQQVYSAWGDSGPVRDLDLTGGDASTGQPYWLSAGADQAVTVTVGIAGSLQLSEEMVLLRITENLTGNRSRSSAIACDASGVDAFRDSVENGCETPYQLSTSGVCPDPNPPEGPATCVPTQPGDFRNPMSQGMNARFSDCPPYNYPDYEDGDPRIVHLMVTDFSAIYYQSGGGEVPITNFATFYIAGWTGSNCPQPEPPTPVPNNVGAIWGHFIKYVAPDPTSVGGPACVADAITPCIPVMTR